MSFRKGLQMFTYLSLICAFIRAIHMCVRLSMFVVEACDEYFQDFTMNDDEDEEEVDLHHGATSSIDLHHGETGILDGDHETTFAEEHGQNGQYRDEVGGIFAQEQATHPGPGVDIFAANYTDDHQDERGEGHHIVPQGLL
eukprot:GSA120T00015438001.1